MCFISDFCMLGLVVIMTLHVNMLVISFTVFTLPCDHMLIWACY